MSKEVTEKRTHSVRTEKYVKSGRRKYYKATAA